MSAVLCLMPVLARPAPSRQPPPPKHCACAAAALYVHAHTTAASCRPGPVLSSQVSVDASPGPISSRAARRCLPEAALGLAGKTREQVEFTYCSVGSRSIAREQPCRLVSFDATLQVLCIHVSASSQRPTGWRCLSECNAREERRGLVFYIYHILYLISIRMFGC